jgi:hypothetical protein
MDGQINIVTLRQRDGERESWNEGETERQRRVTGQSFS